MQTTLLSRLKSNISGKFCMQQRTLKFGKDNGWLNG
jgi:hypothetical protein